MWVQFSRVARSAGEWDSLAVVGTEILFKARSSFRTTEITVVGPCSGFFFRDRDEVGQAREAWNAWSVPRYGQVCDGLGGHNPNRKGSRRGGGVWAEGGGGRGRGLTIGGNILWFCFSGRRRRGKQCSANIHDVRQLLTEDTAEGWSAQTWPEQPPSRAPRCHPKTRGAKKDAGRQIEQ